MRAPTRALPVAALTLLALALSIGTAGAERVGFSPAESISIQGPMTVTPEGMTGIRCNVTLRGTMTGSLIETGTATTVGSITESTVTSCANGIYRLLIPILIREVIPLRNEIPTGVLLVLDNFGVLIENITSCLYGGRTGVLFGLVYREPGYYTVEGEWLTNPAISLVRTLGFGRCPIKATVGGPATLAPQQRVTYLP